MSDPAGADRPRDGVRGEGPARDGPTDSITIAVIEDNRILRRGITVLLNQVPDLNVVAGASGGDLSGLGSVKPEIILLDLGLRNGASLRVARRVGEEFPESRIIVMDLLPVQEDLMEFVNLGVAGFILKDASLEELIRTIRSVAGGTPVLPPQMTRSLFSQIAEVEVARSGTRALEEVRMTSREREVVELISEGLGNKQIAARLHISIHTVKSHVRNIMEKLALHTRLQIAAYAHQNPDEV